MYYAINIHYYQSHMLIKTSANSSAHSSLPAPSQQHPAVYVVPKIMAVELTQRCFLMQLLLFLFVQDESSK